jgi:hypothetical protein
MMTDAEYSAYYETPIERRCDAFGHVMPQQLPPADDLPPCPTCRKIIAAELVVARDPSSSWDRLLYVTDRCGRIGAVLHSRAVGVLPWTAWYAHEPNGPQYVIGRRADKLSAVAAVYASHDHAE